MPTVFGWSREVTAASPPNIVSGWMMGVESNLSTEDRFAAVAPSPTLICSDGDIFIGNISSLSRNDGRDRLHNAMHESRDAVPCAATSLLPSQEHWRAQSVNPDLGLDGAAQAASRHISDASTSVSSPRPIPRISRSVQTPLPHRPVVSAVPPRTNTGWPNQGKYQQYRSRSSRPLHRIPQPGQSPSPGRLSNP